MAMSSDDVTARMRDQWAKVSARLEAYELILPGTPSFICQPHVCDAHCCRRFSVSLGESEAARMHTSSGLQFIDFLEVEDGQPVTLPLAQPYLLARRDNHCALLGDNLGCTQYEGRPRACQQYPHHVLFFDGEAVRPVHGDLPAMAAGLSAALAGECETLTPLLLRHVECPGFTGPPILEGEWRALLQATAVLQYPQLLRQ
ncbi:hypothetical protein AYO38_03940 [bacterium SCGC AG-212-C10]|nr:hypothetical protein AYO38_03940 [bacterium SCGC AG-212-C10]